MLLEGIETLLVLSKAKTMSRTGSLLYISQSAVSKRIANLEKKLGKKTHRAKWPTDQTDARRDCINRGYRTSIQ
jgi:hypothetical protein